MFTLNQLTIIGFTGREAETHHTTNGTLVTTLSVATKESWKNASGSVGEPDRMASRRLLLAPGRICPNAGQRLARDGAGIRSHP